MHLAHRLPPQAAVRVEEEEEPLEDPAGLGLDKDKIQQLEHQLRVHALESALVEGPVLLPSLRLVQVFSIADAPT